MFSYGKLGATVPNLKQHFEANLPIDQFFMLNTEQLCFFVIRDLEKSYGALNLCDDFYHLTNEKIVFSR